MALRPRSGMGYIVLNFLRGLNIVALLLVVVANGIMMFKTSKRSGYFVFDQFSHVATSCITLFLVVSELDFLSALQHYFATYWPLLGLSSGFSTLGLALIIIGCSTLGNLTKSWLSRTELGSKLWIPIAVAGVVAMTSGLLNIALSFLFTDRANGISARAVRVYGATASSSSASTRSGSGKDYLPKYTSSMRSAPSTYHTPIAISSPIRRSNTTSSASNPPRRASSLLPSYTASSPVRRAEVVPGPFPMSRSEVADYVRKSGSGGGAAVPGGNAVVGMERPQSSYHPSRWPLRS